MTAPSPDRAPDEIERKCAEIAESFSDASDLTDLPHCEAKGAHASISWLLATLRETRRELAAITEERDAMQRRAEAAEADWLAEARRAGVTMPNGDTGTR